MSTSTFYPQDGFQTKGHKTSEVAPNTRNRVALAMLLQAQSMGHANVTEFWADCAMCGERTSLDNIDLGHVVPATQDGGYAHPANLLPMCSPCNNSLGDCDPRDYWMLKYDSRDLWTGILPQCESNPRVRDVRSLWTDK